MKRFPAIYLLMNIYLLSLGVFSIFRILLFITEYKRVEFSLSNLSTILQAFIMGIRFDLVITSYILALPALILIGLSFTNKEVPLVKKVLFYYALTLFTIAFGFCAMDIPYFNHFFSRLSVTALEWLSSFSFVFQMTIQEPSYFLAVIPFLLVIYLYFKGLKKIIKTSYEVEKKPSLLTKSLVSALFVVLVFLSIRGRIEQKATIQVATAYFCDDPFLNQLGLNPVFTFMRSYLDSKKEELQSANIMDDHQAIANVQKYFTITKPISESPIARKILARDTSKNYPNIIFIKMESMSAAKMKRHGNNQNLTPFLDSISHHGLYFENIYTAGIHTFNGIFSTLFSFPAIYRQHPLRIINRFNGIADILSKNNYSTTYFTTHDGQFDYVEGFLKANRFENIYSQTNYPSEEIKTTLGVPDDYMFRYAVPVIDKLTKQNKPFFVSLMTTSDHGPYYVPPYFKPKNKDIKQQITEYADWSLSEFIRLCSAKPWFDNTIFVFIADHGAPMEVTYEFPLNYNHTPLLIYAPKLLPTPTTYSQIGGQIDVFPTIMGMLPIDYTNNTLGIDLLKEKRPYIYINGDDKIAVLDTTFMLIMKENTTDYQLVKYKKKDRKNYIKEFPLQAKEMEEYAKANIQTFQYMLNHPSTLYVE